VKDINIQEDFVFSIGNLTAVSWSESTINWSNKPTSQFVTSVTKRRGQNTIEIDVLNVSETITSSHFSEFFFALQAVRGAQQGNGIAGFRLYKSSGNNVARLIMHSKEAGTLGPRLVLQTGTLHGIIVFVFHHN
jgi:hypothetical protein